jgi:hypothetical protein
MKKMFFENFMKWKGGMKGIDITTEGYGFLEGEDNFGERWNGMERMEEGEGG